MLEQVFFVSFLKCFISFLCFIYSFPGIGRCSSHHEDINTSSKALEGKQPPSSGKGAGWRKRISLPGSKARATGLGNSNDLFYQRSVLTGIFYGSLVDIKHSLLLLYSILIYYIYYILYNTLLSYILFI